MKRMVLLVVLLPLMAAVSLTESTRINLLRGSNTIETLGSWDECHARAVQLAQADTRTSGSVSYVCQTERRQVVAVYSVNPPADADGDGVPDSTDQCPGVAGPAPSGCPVSTDSDGDGVPDSADACPTVPASTPDGCPVAPPSSAAAYSDLSSAPVGATVTWYDALNQKIGSAVWQGTPVTINGQSYAVATHNGRVLQATPSTLKTVWAGLVPGDVIQLRAGTYTGTYGEGTWTMDSQLDTFKQCTATQPCALLPYPGESVTFRSTAGHANFTFGDGNGAKARYITVAGLNIIGTGECVSAGGDTSTDTKPESGGQYIRLVANRLEMTDATGNTMTGLVAIQGDGWQVLGNTFVDPANRVVINNNHALYIQNGADDVEAAYNVFRNLHVGFTVQIHQDGNPMLYERINVHHNTFEASNADNMRGATTSNIQTASTVTFAHNSFKTLGGGGWGCLNVYAGQVTITANVCENTQNGLNVNGDTSQSRHITMDGNKLCPAAGYSRISYENGASASQVTETNPLACN